MKILRYKTFTFIAALTLLVSCVDDGIINKGQEPVQGDTPYFVKLRLKTSDNAFTRAEGEEGPWSDPAPGSGFVDGIHDEHAISKGGNFAIFFDGDDKYIATADLYAVNETTGETDKNTEGANPETYYLARFYGFADRQPEKVLVVVNAADDIKERLTDFPGWTLKEVMAQEWQRNGGYGGYNGGEDWDELHGTVNINSTSADPLWHLGFRQEGGKTYFAMTNATYLKKIQNEENEEFYVLHCAEDIKKYDPDDEEPEGNLTTDEGDIDKLTPVTVTLERMVSKYTFNIQNTTGQYLPYNADALDVCSYIRDQNDNNVGKFQYTQYKWAVQILGWGVNGYERSNYLFKNVNPDAEYFEEEKDWGWNSTYNKRCYWSEDPHYTKEEAHYPWQFRDAKDKNNDGKNDAGISFFRNYKDPTNGEPFSLTYYPFTKFVRNVDEDGVLYADEERTKGKEIFDDDGNFKNDYTYHHNDSIFYSPENTYEPGIVVDRTRASRAYELAGTHILLACQLRIDLDGNNEYNHTPENIYRNRVGVSYINELDMFEDFMNAVNFKLTSQKYLYYNYTPWEQVENERTVNAGQVMRAVVGGNYALYYHYEDMGDTDGNGNPIAIDEYRELTYNNLLNIHNWDKEKGDFFMTVEAEALNGDGKVMPWICYKKKGEDKIRELELLILSKDNPDALPGKYPTPGTTYDPNNSAIGEVISLTGLQGNALTAVENYINNRRINFQQSDPSYEAKDKSETDGWRPLGYKTVNGKRIYERNSNDLKSVFFEIWGVADHFNHGLMYYAVPIEALTKDKQPAITGNTDNPDLHFNTDVPEPSPGDNNYKKFWGYHGVVRNNWYNFTLRTINDIGIPVSDPTQPIVPNYHKKLDQVKVEMEILQWHVEDIDVPVL